jgi:hypothetical protein
MEKNPILQPENEPRGDQDAAPPAPPEFIEDDIDESDLGGFAGGANHDYNDGPSGNDSF